MSRHRRERVPRHRAQRSAGYPARRAPMPAAVRPSGTALDGAGDDAEIGLQAAGSTLEAGTAPLAVLTASPDGGVAVLADLAASDDGAMPGRRTASHSPRHSRQGASIPHGSAPASGPAGNHPRVARGLLMTPWFAASAGFVIAASLWIYSPHPQLAFPAIAIGKVPRVPCDSSACGSHVDQQGVGSLTIKSGERATQQHKSAAPAKTRTSDRASTAASGLTFGYVVVRTAPGNFELMVTITGKHPIKDWQLAFVLPGAHIVSVFGAHWEANGSDGMIASPLAGDRGGPGDYGGGHGYDGGAPGQFRISFEVVASGSPVRPAHCSFDGASCTFRELSSPSQWARG